MKGKKRISLLAALVCIFALVFSMGLMSACGNTDNNTTSSNQWYYGAEVPADTLGHEGDYYLNTQTLASYVKSDDGTWTETAANWYYGTEEPVANLGATNDFYLNTNTGALYQKKADDWGSPILTLKGEQGKPGRDGVLWYSNKGNPNTLKDKTALAGSYVGDFYLDTESFDVYQKTSDTEWEFLGSIMGRGTTWFDGNLEPDNADLKGVYEGDYYYRSYIDIVENTSNYQIYRYEGGKWVLMTSVVAGSLGDAFKKTDGESYLDVAEDGTVTITGVAAGTTKLTVPGTLNGKPVVIGEQAFANHKELTSITLEEGIKEIGSNAFYKTGLKEVVLPEGLEEIGTGIFAYCEDLTSVTLPKSLTNIKTATFYQCTSLEKADIPEGVTEIGYQAFYGCKALQKIIMPDTVTKIGVVAFCDCAGATEIKLSENLTAIPQWSFQGCKGITELTIPESVKEIGYNAFVHCDQLAKIRIPAGVTKIEETAFIDYQGSLEVAAENTHYEVINDLLLSKGDTRTLLWAKKDIESATIPADVTRIGDYAFNARKNLTKIDIPASVISIGLHAFYGCDRLADITLTQNIVSIGSGAFEDTAYFNDAENWTGEAAKQGVLYMAAGENAHHFLLSAYGANGDTAIAAGTVVIADSAFRESRSSLRSITIPESVKVIGKGAFLNCDFLANAEIPAGVTAVGEGAFHTNTIVTVQAENEKFEVKTVNDSVNGNWSYMVEKETMTLLWVRPEEGCTKIVIPEGIKKIGYSAFNACTKLQEIVVADTVTEVEENAFKSCTALTSVTFRGCVSIGAQAFLACKTIKSVTFEKYSPEMEIDRTAFEECKTLTDVAFAGTKTEWNALMQATDFFQTLTQEITVTCKGETGADKTMVFVRGYEQ